MQPCRATFVDDDGKRHKHTHAVKIDEKTYVFGVHRDGYFRMVAVDSIGSKIQTRRALGYSNVVTKEIWNSGTIGGTYTAEDVKLNCGRVIFETH